MLKKKQHEAFKSRLKEKQYNSENGDFLCAHKSYKICLSFQEILLFYQLIGVPLHVKFQKKRNLRDGNTITAKTRSRFIKEINKGLVDGNNTKGKSYNYYWTR